MGQIVTRLVLTAVCGFLCPGFHSVAVAAAGYFPEAVFESKAIEGAVFSAAPVPCAPSSCLVYVARDKLVLAEWRRTGEVSPRITIAAKDGESFHRLHVGDYDFDGDADVLVNGFQAERAFSRLYEAGSDRLTPVQDFPAIVMPLLWKGETHLYSQSLRGRGEWSRVLVRQAFRDGRFRDSDNGLRLAKGVGSHQTSLFHLTSLGERLAVLNEDGTVALLDGQGKRVWRSGLRYGGAVDVLGFAGRDPLGMKRKDEQGLPPRMAFDSASQTLYVIKNSGFLPSVIGAFPVMKAAQYAALGYTGEGLQERGLSRRVDGAFSDLTLLDADGDGLQNEILLVFWTRAGGVIEGSSPQHSRVVILRTGPPASPIVTPQSAGTH